MRGRLILRRLFLRRFAGRLADRSLDSSAARLGETDGDGLLGRSRTMFSFTHVLDLLAHIFPSLRAGGFAFLLVLGRSAAGTLFGHDRSPTGGVSTIEVRMSMCRQSTSPECAV